MRRVKNFLMIFWKGERRKKFFKEEGGKKFLRYRKEMAGVR